MIFHTSFVDFDNTLYNTHQFVQDVVACLGRHGIPHNVARSTLEAAVHGKTGAYYDYTFAGHVALLAERGYPLKLAAVVDELSALLKNHYQEPDAEVFLRELRKYSERVVLLTAGSEAFQGQKLASTTLGSLLDDVHVLHAGKGEYVRSVIDSLESPSKRSVFINDNLPENISVRRLCPEAAVVTKRHPTRYTKEELDASGIPYFDTLTGILHYIEHEALREGKERRRIL